MYAADKSGRMRLVLVGRAEGGEFGRFDPDTREWFVGAPLFDWIQRQALKANCEGAEFPASDSELMKLMGPGEVRVVVLPPDGSLP